MHDDESTMRLFEAQVISTLKSRQVKATWLGILLSVIFYIMLVVISSA